LRALWNGVVYKRASGCSARFEFLQNELDLVCLATIADVVPLLDENRWLSLRPG